MITKDLSVKSLVISSLILGSLLSCTSHRNTPPPSGPAPTTPKQDPKTNSDASPSPTLRSAWVGQWTVIKKEDQDYNSPKLGDKLNVIQIDENLEVTWFLKNEEIKNNSLPLLAIQKEQIRLLHDDEGESSINQEGLQKFKEKGVPENIIQHYINNPPKWILKSEDTILFFKVRPNGEKLTQVFKKISPVEAEKIKTEYLEIISKKNQSSAIVVPQKPWSDDKKLGKNKKKVHPKKVPSRSTR